MLWDSLHVNIIQTSRCTTSYTFGLLVSLVINNFCYEVYGINMHKNKIWIRSIFAVELLKVRESQLQWVLLNDVTTLLSHFEQDSRGFCCVLLNLYFLFVCFNCWIGIKCRCRKKWILWLKFFTWFNSLSLSKFYWDGKLAINGT